MESESYHVIEIHTSENLANILTKTIPKDKFELCDEAVVMISLSLKKMKIPPSSELDWRGRFVESIPYFRSTFAIQLLQV